MSTPFASLSSSAPSPTTTNPGALSFNNGGKLTSLYLYTFVATITTLLLIFSALVARSIHLRRRRNAAFIAAIAAGTYVPPLSNGKRRIDPLLPEPALWEVHIAASRDKPPEKEWGEMIPVAGTTLVPVPRRQIDAPLRHSRWLLPFRRDNRQEPAAPESDATPTTAASLSPPESDTPLPPAEPVSLAVLISMPTRTVRGRTGGPPVVEFGVAHVSYAEPCGALPHAVQCT